MAKTTEEQIQEIHDRQARRQEALRLQVEEGMSLREIGKVLGVTRQRAKQLIDQARSEQEPT